MFSFFKRSKQPSTQEIKAFIASMVHEKCFLEDVKTNTSGDYIVVLQPFENKSITDDLVSNIKSYLKTIKQAKKVIVVVTDQVRASNLPEASPPKSKIKGDMENLPPVIIAIASGKGGVGKSTVSINLACALMKLGKRVGVLDADIYGPSLPRLVGKSSIKANPDTVQGQIKPIEAYGLKTMSMGYLVNEESAMIWRGPMAQSALLQMLRDVDWTGLDILVIDMPPGTGDIHLTLAQRVPLSGGVIVSTPQDIALIDARKGIEMFNKVEVPILGIIENMSVFCCPNCGHKEDIFGSGGAKKEAEKIGVPFLGDIPLHTKIRQLSDAGEPIVISLPDSPQAQEFIMIASRVLDSLKQDIRPAPTIRFED
jgi:ATP-binding protein involved in chromosome partitioning